MISYNGDPLSPSTADIASSCTTESVPIKTFIAVGMALFFVSLAASAYRGTPFVSYEIFVDVTVGVLLLTAGSAVRRSRSERSPNI